MTRLRIKTADGKVERVTVPAGTTLSGLKQIIAKDILRRASPAEVKLSLNKKVLRTIKILCRFLAFFSGF